MPRYTDLDWRGLERFTPQQFDDLVSFDRAEWKQEILQHDELFIALYDRLPKELSFIRDLLLSAIWRSPEHWGLQPERP
jgi:phosphoenolpyruvate carboxykinase (GTP)